MEFTETLGQGEGLTHPPRNCKQKECVEMLIKAGANVNAQTDDGISALMKASENGYGECVKLLLEAAADVNAACKKGFTSLIYSVMNGHEACVKCLIAAGGDVNALVRAAEISNIVIIKRLLKANCRINMTAGMGYAFASPLIKTKDITVLLFAAGEKGHCSLSITAQNILKLGDLGIQLKHICRKTIRKHLLDLDHHSNLFGRIPLLGLPKLLNIYLLYGESLDDDSDP